jgi:hypothetical protein
MEPNDVDCVLLMGSKFPSEVSAVVEFDAGLPFMEMKLVGQADFDAYVNVTYRSDRMGIFKGTIEVIL